MKVKEKALLKLNIRKQGINGEGIGYYDRLAVFVPGAIRKEVVQVQITEVFERYAQAKLIKIIRPSKKRVKPLCKHYDRCGHCQMQHIEYNEQLKNKQLLIEQSLKRFASMENVKSKVDYALHGELSYGYRRQMEFTLKNTNFGLELGLFNTVTNEFVPIDDCKVVDQEINQIARLALQLFKEHKLKAFDKQNIEGILFDLVIRYFKDTDSASVVMVVSKKTKALKEIADEMITKFQSIESVGYCIHNRESHITLFNPVEILAGETHLTTDYHGGQIKVSPRGIYPDYKEVFEMMDDRIVLETGLSEDHQLLNLYQYSTLSSLYFSQYCKKVTAVDYDETSINDGKINQSLFKIGNIRWIQDHVESVLEQQLDQSIDILNMYAPKHGLGYKVINLIRQNGPKQLVYVSENPSTMAKDIDRLSSRYNVTKVVPVDMHPQSANVYSMTFLDRI